LRDEQVPRRSKFVGFGLAEGANLPGFRTAYRLFEADDSAERGIRGTSHSRTDLREMQTIQDEPAHRCNRCTPHAHRIRHETDMRYRQHILPLLRRLQALLDLQTVNAQKNLQKKLSPIWTE